MDTSSFAEVRALTDNLGINLHEALFAAPPASQAVEPQHSGSIARLELAFLPSALHLSALPLCGA